MLSRESSTRDPATPLAARETRPSSFMRSTGMPQSWRSAHWNRGRRRAGRTRVAEDAADDQGEGESDQTPGGRSIHARSPVTGWSNPWRKVPRQSCEPPVGG